MEDMSDMEDLEAGDFDMDMTEEKTGFFSGFMEKHQQKLLPAALAVIVVLVVVIVVMAVRHRKAKAELDSDEDEEE